MADYSNPQRDEENQKRAKRIKSVSMGLHMMKLSCFTVGEFIVLQRFLNDKPWDSDFILLEKKIKKYKRKTR